MKKCKFDIKTYENPNSAECIRCGDCIKVCPENAIKTTFSKESESNSNSKKTSAPI